MMLVLCDAWVAEAVAAALLCITYMNTFYCKTAGAQMFIISTGHMHTHTHTRLTALCPGLPRWDGNRKVNINLDFTEARDSEWQWHQLGCMQVCTSLQTDNHASTPPLCFLQARCPSCRPTNSVKALKAPTGHMYMIHNHPCSFIIIKLPTVTLTTFIC